MPQEMLGNVWQSDSRTLEYQRERDTVWGVKCFKVEGRWSIFVGKHQCFKSDVVSYRKPVKGPEQ